MGPPVAPRSSLANAVQAALGRALLAEGLTLNVQVSLWPAPEPGAVELENIWARPQRCGYGSRAMALLVAVADDAGVDLVLRVADASDDLVAWAHDDPRRPPSCHELVRWYGRYGFTPASSPAGIHMRRPGPGRKLRQAG